MDPIIAATHADPYPYYATLRTEGGWAFHDGLKMWVASSADAVAAVMAHPDCRVRPLNEPVPKAIAEGDAGKIFGQLMRMNEGERQRCPRAAIEPALAAVNLSDVRARVSARWITAGAQGLYNAMFRGPVSVVAALLGFSPAQARAISELTADFVACLSPLSEQTQVMAAQVAAELLHSYFIELLDDAYAQTPLLKDIQQRFAMASSDHDMLIANLIGLCSQTYEATAGLIGNGLVALIRQPSLRNEMTGVDELIGEIQRIDPSVQNTRRFVAEPCEINGSSLRPGDVILLILASANRDPLLNDDPDAVCLSRANRRSFSFGAGRHQCPGQALALSIASATLTQILEANPVLDRLTWHYRPSLNSRIPMFIEAQA
ncbi:MULTISPECIES: cytochrome P450 [unclassified Pseudomonas]|uniref:cytochrome P450 n=1 Tax=unclassified Pseudomonas TaxID=196821 RepID=UPI002AC8B4FE|nr:MULTISPECIES: cytochrome P450 [unclassified Pseudomonas]MEB0045683.1 cytochrome P450 [Pseudomonas sp. Dout3]MEB0095566.1 cytochrome P450 [Pseudomonas sp. DC1.2]WPX61147.1 cytochrome P450 [Pseudomonas sp. DC1.2]